MNVFSKTDNLTSTDEEVSLADILSFIAESWQTVLVFTLLGLGVAGAYLFFTPKQYEAIAQIKMAQIVIPNDNNNNNNLIGVNIEEPTALISRMTFPTTFDAQTIQECERGGLADREDSGSALAKGVKLSIPKGVTSTVVLKILAPSPELAKICVNALYQFIKSSQSQLIPPYIKDAKIRLSFEQERLLRVTQKLTGADKYGAAATGAYLASLEEMRYLFAQINSLQNTIIQNDRGASNLIAPIYVNERPVFPSKINSLLVGMVTGGFLGLLIAFIRKRYRSNQALFKR